MGYHAPRNKDFRAVSTAHYFSYLRRVEQTWASNSLINESITHSPYLYEMDLLPGFKGVQSPDSRKLGSYNEVHFAEVTTLPVLIDFEASQTETT